MIEYILPIFIILIVTVGYKWVYIPWKLYNRYLKSLKQKGYKVYNVPFVPLGAPFFGIIMRDTKQGDALKITKTVYTDHDVVLANSLQKVVLDFTHPDFIKDFYSNEHLYTFPKVKLFTQPIQRAMGSGIPFSQGDVWKRKRRIINGVFNFDFIKSMTGKIEKLCSKAIKDVEETATHIQQNGEHVVEYDIINLTVRMFSSVIMECFLGGATDQKLEGKPLCIFMNQLIADVTQQAFSVLTFILGVKYSNLGLRANDRDINRRLALFKNWGLKYIKNRIQQAKQKIQKQKEEDKDKKRQPDDIIQALVRARSNPQTKSQDAYSDEQILQEFCTFFVAGTDTTSHYVMMMIYYIAQNPRVEQKLRKQIETHMSTDDYSYENLKKLVYMDYVQKQTTRMYGPVNNLFLRQAKQDNYLNGLAIKKGTYVTIQLMGNHYSEKYFKDPFVFRPERWEKQCEDIPAFALGGFSAGARTCIGKHLVQIESKIGLIKFMKRYKKITIPDGPLKMVIKFVYSPEYFKSKMIINEPQRKE